MAVSSGIIWWSNQCNIKNSVKLCVFSVKLCVIKSYTEKCREDTENHREKNLTPTFQRDTNKTFFRFNPSFCHFRLKKIHFEHILKFIPSNTSYFCSINQKVIHPLKNQNIMKTFLSSKSTLRNRQKSPYFRRIIDGSIIWDHLMKQSV